MASNGHFLFICILRPAGRNLRAPADGEARKEKKMKSARYTIVDQHNDDKVFERYSTLAEAKKGLRLFYYWHPDELSGVALYKDGAIYSEEYCRTNPNYQ